MQWATLKFVFNDYQPLKVVVDMKGDKFGTETNQDKECFLTCLWNSLMIRSFRNVIGTMIVETVHNAAMW